MKNFIRSAISVTIVKILMLCPTNAHAQQVLPNMRPFFRSLVFNQNVYKTKDSLDLTKIYDNDNGIPINDTVTYRLNPFDKNHPGSFLRYAELNDSGDIAILILQGTRFTRRIKKQPMASANSVQSASIDLLKLAAFGWINKAITNPAKAAVVDSIISFAASSIKKNFVDTIEQTNIDSIIYIEYSDKDTGNNPHSYYFKVKGTPTSAQKYLATQHITGLPVTIPIKYRFKTPPNRTAWSTNIALAYAFGYKLRVNNNPYKDKYVRLLAVTGLGTDNYIPADSISKDSDKGEQNIIWSYGAGITYEIGSRFNIGVFTGADKMFGSKKNWYYQGKWWLGFGLGYKFN